ncbi:Eco57I restriction-modification methylase domain-containing protein, partial [Muricoccus nepalensis]
MRGQPDAAQDVNKHWLGEVQPVGVVVTAGALAEQALVPAQQSRLDSEAVRELLRGDDEGAPALRDPWSFFSEVLDWRPSQVAGSPNGPEIPDALRIVLPASETVLEPQLAVMTPDKAGWQILVRCEASGVEPDARGSLPGWEATPHQRLERLLRDTGVPTGILLTDDALRLVHAPANGESSGWFSVPLRALGTTAGRTMLGALKLLLDRIRLFNDAESRRLPALLMASRRAQASVSATLATQVLGALHDLLRGLHAAAPDATAVLARQRPEHLYEGLLAMLMRLVFLLYAEDRGLIPSRDDPASRTFYEANYGVRGLHARLGEDAALHPDTMDERRGAWHQLLVLFRLVHTGDGSGWMRGRGGKLFNPASFPFLQGQDVAGDPIRIPPISDGCVLRILDGLLLLKGERLSYRALDVEQIGSVYETVMGFTAEPAAAASIAIEAGKRNRTPVFVDLPALLAQPGNERGTWLKQATERGKFPPKVEKALAAAKDEAALAAALGEVFDKRGSPDARVWPAGTPLLQPTDERRRTGSHYTPRDLTGPIVRHALEPAFTRISPAATPEDVLSLKVCDPAMGSGAFLVEACRQLGARLVEAWRVHEDKRPVLPPDEDEELHARRLVAQRCLYGVDRNPMAVDLARLSLWLATLARDHEFTFLDHALRCGDSLVGLSRAQVERLDWADQAQPSLFSSFVSARLERAAAARSEIRAAGDDVALFEQERRQALAEKELADLRRAGNAAVAQFFGHGKDKARRTALDQLHEAGLDTTRLWTAIDVAAATLRTEPHPLQPFHWELEFPEVFADPTPGFDAIVGNPPFAGKNTLINGNREHYLPWLQAVHPGAHGNADLVAHFVRRAFALLRPGGCFGLIATNTVGQGDTRDSGLRAVLAAGGTIVRAVRRLPWPGEAAVVVSVVHVVKGTMASPVLDGRQVRRISAYLVEGDLDDSPAQLVANEGKVFVGMYLLGLGFTFDDEAVRRGKPASPVAEMHRLIAKDPRNAERIFPYLGGEEVNTDPHHAHRRWCIDFDDF